MKTILPSLLSAALLLLFGAATTIGQPNPSNVRLDVVSSMTASQPGVSAAEIVAHDPITQRLYVVNAVAARIDIFDIHDAANPSLAGFIEIQGLDPAFAGSVANSVAIKNGLIAVALESSPKTSPGHVLFFDSSNTLLAAVQVGAQPDMITFTEDGRYVLTANEGEPSGYPSTPEGDPEGSVSIIDLGGGLATLNSSNVRTATFSHLTLATLPAGVRIFGPGASVAQDLEPEYIATSKNSRTAWVTLQENNAMAIIDIPSATVTRIVPLGTKDHSLLVNALDTSDRDPQVPAGLADANLDGVPDGINIKPRPGLVGLYLPDSIASFRAGKTEYLVLANEGDAREWPGYVEEITVNSPEYVLDPVRFPDPAAIKANSNMGRLRASRASGDIDGDGDYDVIHAFGGRSFSIRTVQGDLVWDSGSQFESKIASLLPTFFNASNGNNTFDSRSTSKGPEPEGITVGTAFGRQYAFIGLERIGGVMAYDVSVPTAPVFAAYANNRDFTAPTSTPAAKDLGPEGVIFIEEENSPTGTPLVVVANEVSGTTTIFSFTRTP